jgi:hypothetical protein
MILLLKMVTFVRKLLSLVTYNYHFEMNVNLKENVLNRLDSLIFE